MTAFEQTRHGVSESWTTITSSIGPVWLLAADAPLSEEQLLHGASEETVLRASELKAPLRRFEYLRARWLMRSAAQLGKDPASHPDGDILWPAGLIGSLSHKQGAVALTIQNQEYWSSVGIDLERALVRPELSAKIVTSEEWSLLLNHWSENDAAAPVFAAKEAVFKAVFPLGRQMFWFHDATVKSVQAFHGSWILSLQLKEAFGLQTHTNHLIDVNVIPVEIGLEGLTHCFWLAVCGVSKNRE